VLPVRLAGLRALLGSIAIGAAATAAGACSGKALLISGDLLRTRIVAITLLGGRLSGLELVFRLPNLRFLYPPGSLARLAARALHSGRFCAALSTLPLLRRFSSAHGHLLFGFEVPEQGGKPRASRRL
jgi:hypothetical protein